MIEGEIFLPMIIFLVAGIFSAIFRGKLAVYTSSMGAFLAGLLLLYFSTIVLMNNAVLEGTIIIPYNDIDQLLPIRLDAINFVMDSLSAFFVFILGVLTICSSMYALSYMNTYLGKENLGFYSINYLFFLFSMYTVLIVHDLFWFIVFWEIMTLTSQFLVSFEKEKEKAVWAGYKYFVMTKAGSEFLIVSLIIIMIILGNGDTSYSTLYKITSINPCISDILIGLFFIGMIVKAALVPLHNWLPDAHPEAPSHVSALLSGFMIKIPIYYILRIMLLLLTKNYPHIYIWSILLIVLGSLSLLIGAFHALVQRDIKRLLAYSSIEQIGLITLGIGSFMYLYSLQDPYHIALSYICLLGTIYHVLNHAIYKSLLFMTSGNVKYVTGTRNIDELGGLSNILPYTSFSALIGSLSIAGIPPLNGFISKYMILVALLLSSNLLGILGVLLFFVSALTSLVYVKYYSGIFLRPSRNKTTLKEAPVPMTMPTLFLSILCIVLGIAPLTVWVIMKHIIPVSIFSSIISNYINISWTSISIIEFSSYSPLFIAVFIGLLTPLFFLIMTRYTRQVDTWLCGNLIRLQYASIRSKGYESHITYAFREIYSVSEYLYKQIIRTGYSIKDYLSQMYWFEEPSPMIVCFLLIFLSLLIYAIMVMSP